MDDADKDGHADLNVAFRSLIRGSEPISTLGKTYSYFRSGLGLQFKNIDLISVIFSQAIELGPPDYRFYHVMSDLKEFMQCMGSSVQMSSNSL